MDPLTVVSGVAALVGLGLAWVMYRRASRAEAEVAHLRGALSAGRAGAHQATLPNQRPWRLAPQQSPQAPSQFPHAFRGHAHPP